MANQLVHVGVREFRDDLARYLDSEQTVAITRNGQTVGFFVPARRRVDKAEMAALSEAVGEMERLLAEAGITEDEVVREFQAQRKRG